MTQDQITKYPHGSICIVWEIKAVNYIRPDLTDPQCEEVLQHCVHKHHPYVGINLDVIRDYADDLFPEPCGE